MTIGVSSPLCSQSTVFNDATLHGRYAFHNLAWFVDTSQNPPVSAPFAFSGLWTFDGKGKLTATDTLNDPTGSGVITNRNYSGTYSVNHDGTGTIDVTIAQGITVHYTLALAANGEVIEVITTREGIVSTFTLEKQSTQ
jgi:hypothetical protein